jgi:hypothetical protein
VRALKGAGLATAQKEPDSTEKATRRSTLLADTAEIEKKTTATASP